MIHSCNKRLWYVKNFLIPDMLSQGIDKDDIILFNDNNGDGCLKMWIKSMQTVADCFPKNEATWHLQDDILISSDFKRATEECRHDIVANGICLWERQFRNCVGLQPNKNRWMSFQCIQIPNSYASGFLDFFNNTIVARNREARKRAANKHCDHFFYLYIKECKPDEKMLNMCPNIVQHIDYIIGGTTLNYAPRKYGRGYYWIEDEKEERLSEQIKQFLTDNADYGKTEN